MELPVRTPAKDYRTLEEIRQRKEELATSLQEDNKQFSALWGSMFVKKSQSSKGEWVASLIGNSVTAIDAFLLARKLMKSYGSLFHRKK